MVGPISLKSGSNMGYYTYFTLEYQGDPDEEERLEEYNPDDDSDEYSDPYYVKGILDDRVDHEYKWYDWEKDMMVLASKFPNILFILHGDGETSDDLWEFRRKGSESEFHSFEMPPFTNKNLQI